ncbi:MAG TPA: DUF3180 family protein [Candidatus Avipropionibacterium avicola]|uniref:DUF3180 family protein n=1 Tax=Candidatus Avipropionibacterium avicola TaxID=2840701 RepID=A0A9D1GVN8_9ACTN|nr:DUF3180 family protein [Candidatus Avipropionibacterium avicola]
MTDPEGATPSEPEPELTGRISITPWWHIGVAAVAGALVGRIVVLVVTSLTGAAPSLPWTLVLLLWLLVLTVAELARSTRRRVHVERRWVAAHRGIRLLAIGKAAALTGGFVAGALVAFGLGFVDRLHIPALAWRAGLAGLGAVAGVLVAVAGRALQRACHVPEDDPPAPAAR